MNLSKTLQRKKQQNNVDEETMRAAANFRRLRKLSGLTLKQLAEKAFKVTGEKVSWSYISQLEHGDQADGRPLGKFARAKWARIFSNILKVKIDVSEFLRPVLPVDETFESEVALLLQDLQTQGYNTNNVKQLRRLIPLMFRGQPDENSNDHSQKEKAV